MVYQYVAYNEQGEMVKGKLSAATEEAVNDMLSYAGYHLINLRPYVPFLSMERLSGQFFQVKPSEILLLYRQLALLLESGINIVTALELLQSQVDNRALKKVLNEIVADLRGGSQLSAAMSKHPEIFPPLSCRTLSIGEQTGGMEVMLRQIADYMEKETTAKKGIKGALMYPVIASIVAVVVISVLVGFVLPAFGELYVSIGAELPALTRMMMDFSTMFRSNALYILLAMIITGGLALAYIKTPEGGYNLDKLLLRVPMLGRVKQLGELARCCRSISLLFTAGLPLTEIMPLVIQGTNSRVMSRALYDVQQDMLKGEGLSRPMSKNTIFLPMMVQMVKVGEQTGNLDASLQAVSQNYEAEVEDKTKSLIGLIQPVMTLVIAGVVGLIALSMVSAMYSMYGQAF
ncbi:type II secretion system F family protein [Chloroflexota bacterium]